MDRRRRRDPRAYHNILLAEGPHFDGGTTRPSSHARQPNYRAAASRPGDDPIFALHGEATRRAAAGEDILNATLGALVDDDGKLCVMPTVFEAFRAVDPMRGAAYAPIGGDAEFLDF